MKVISKVKETVKTSRVLFYISIFLLITNISLVVHDANSHTWSPLGTYNTQIVLNPKLTVDDTLNVVASKCNNTRSPVNVISKIDYISLDHPDLDIPLPTQKGGGGIRQPGCIVKTYHNILPPNLIKYIEGTKKPERFYLQGTEVPIRAHGGNGKTKIWTSDSFLVEPSK